MTRLSGRVAIITGAGRGIGRATAERFAAEGAKIVIATRSSIAGEATLTAIEGAGGEAVLFVGDISQREVCRRLVVATIDRFGRLDIVVHNAAFAEGGMLTTTDEKHLDATLNVGLKPCFWLTADAVPHLEKSPAARILITSSIAGNRHVMPGRVAYAAMKSGVNGFIRGAAIELAGRRITVNGVEPGLTITDSVKRVISPEYLARLEAAVPLGRAVHAYEIAAAFIYLASDEAEMMTGQTLVIDGGSVLGPPESQEYDNH